MFPNSCYGYEDKSHYGKPFEFRTITQEKIHYKSHKSHQRGHFLIIITLNKYPIRIKVIVYHRNYYNDLFMCKWKECVLGIKTTPTKYIIKMEPR